MAVSAVPVVTAESSAARVAQGVLVEVPMDPVVTAATAGRAASWAEWGAEVAPAKAPDSTETVATAGMAVSSAVPEAYPAGQPLSEVMVATGALWVVLACAAASVAKAYGPTVLPLLVRRP